MSDFNKGILDRLRNTVEPIELPGFRVYSVPRDPWPGCGSGRFGIAATHLLDGYLTGLNAADEMLSLRRGIKLTRRDVFILDLAQLHIRKSSDPRLLYRCPFTAMIDGEDVILLPSRSTETTVEAAKSRACAEAAHEVAHLFNDSAGPRINGHWWTAFDEATAAFTERQVFKSNQWALTFCSDWLDQPHEMLFGSANNANDWIFLQYLNNLSPGIVDRVWSTARPTEDPFDAIVRLTNLDIETTLSNYFAHSYFASEVCPGLQELYSPFRACVSSVILGNDEPHFTDLFDLSSLTCRYYRFKVETNTKLRITIRTQSSHCLAFATECLADMTRGVSKALDREGDGSLVTDWTHDQSAECDHLVLCVANPKIVAPTQLNPRGKVINYSLKVELIL